MTFSESVFIMTKEWNKGRQARANVLGIVEEGGVVKFDIPSFVKGDLFKGIAPGSLEFLSIVKSLEYWNKGDIGRFALSLMSAPIQK